MVARAGPHSTALVGLPSAVLVGLPTTAPGAHAMRGPAAPVFQVQVARVASVQEFAGRKQWRAFTTRVVPLESRPCVGRRANDCGRSV